MEKESLEWVSFGSQNVMFYLVFESVLKEFDNISRFDHFFADLLTDLIPVSQRVYIDF
jgi:hypothetical protein